MRVVVYTNTRAPAGYTSVARLYVNGKPLAIIFEGSDAGQVARSAETWFDTELAKLRARAAHKGKHPPPRSRLEGVIDPQSL